MSVASFALALAAAAGPMNEEEAVREFATICIAHFRDLAAVKRAAAASSHPYLLHDAGSVYSSRVWTSPGVSIDYYEGGRMSSRFGPQCTLTADLSHPADTRRLYGAVARMPGAAKFDSVLAPWLDGPAWTLPGLKTVVVQVDAARRQRVILSLQPVTPLKGMKMTECRTDRSRADNAGWKIEKEA